MLNNWENTVKKSNLILDKNINFSIKDTILSIIKHTLY